VAASAGVPAYTTRSGRPAWMAGWPETVDAAGDAEADDDGVGP